MKLILVFIITFSLLTYSLLDSVSDSEILNHLDSICKDHNLNPENFQLDGKREINRGLLQTEHYFVFVSNKNSAKIEIVAYSGLRGGEIHHMVEK